MKKTLKIITLSVLTICFVSPLYSCNTNANATGEKMNETTTSEGEKDWSSYAQEKGIIGGWVDGTGNIVRIQSGTYKSPTGEIKKGLLLYPKRGIDIFHPVLLNVIGDKITFTVYDTKSDFMVDFVENKIHYSSGRLYNLSGKMNKI